MKRLDLKTRLFLVATNAKITKEQKYTIKENDIRLVYIFKDYEEFKKYFEKYISNVNEDIINVAIYKKTKKGVIVAHKALCDYIITRELKCNDNTLNKKTKHIRKINSLCL